MKHSREYDPTAEASGSGENAHVWRHVWAENLISVLEGGLQGKGCPQRRTRIPLGPGGRETPMIR